MALFTPTSSGGKITFRQILQRPSVIESEIRRLTEEDSLTSKFFTPFAGPVAGGGMEYNKASLAELTLENEVEERAPGGEYRVTRPVDPDADVAPVHDWGTTVQVYEEQLARGQGDYLKRVAAQISNTLVLQLDSAAMAALTAACDPAESILGSDWSDLVFVGDPTDITPSSERPTADLSRAQLAADLQGLGHQYDTLIVHPTQGHELRSAYGPDLSGALASAGITSLVTNRLVEPGVAWALKQGGVGYVGFEDESGIVVRATEYPNRRTLELTAYFQPALAISDPSACKRITALAG
ncbi:hypothetical protein GOHSU_68_00140 [Gordonia hirsuta DSM 44140 = NBRC 16056]|uniref:Phage major capsid protein n=1 Tax=Gordonia hirsuta DSM 44140 = NBRC 16056 TaxID=1121927 RepID=L7LG17_9ACTN|nr:major capsid protein [Gordonia hirsuta]GAC59022.1 hypothetical protein GOHSU_68_00140 [Gordonia hirsuta DSM 44140 = NBRC 16056]